MCQDSDYPFEIECYGDEKGLHGKIRPADIPAAPQAMPLFSLSKFAFDLLAFLQPLPITGRITQGYPDIFVVIFLFDAVILQANG